ncbi:MAG: 6-pyruvoyl-tetrahydropterin synthase-related protein, partial [Candidatus Nanoarchaeia archaeon]
MKFNYILARIFALVIIATVAPWVQQGVPQTDDFRHHLTRFWWTGEQVKQFSMGDWVPSVYSGFPLAHFYHALPYFIVLPFYFFLAPVAMLKFNMVLAIILGPLAMLWAARKLTGSTQIGLVSAIIYALAPIRFEFAYISGSISRQWAYIFLPLAFVLFILAVDKRDMKYTIYAALAYAALIYTHLNIAFALANIYAAYLIYVLIKRRKIELKLIKQMAVFSVLSLALLGFWILPLLSEVGETAAGVSDDTTVSFPAPVPLGTLLVRDFGLKQLPTGQMRFFYLGWSILLLAAVTLLGKFKYKTPLWIATILGILLTITSVPLRFVASLFGDSYPIYILTYSIYFVVVALVPLSILAAIGLKALAKNFKMPAVILIVGIAIILIDVSPAIAAYNWMSQPTEQFTNPPQLIQAWNQIGQQPGTFRVHSAIGQVPFMYHKKYEIGTGWMGCRTCPINPLRKITNDLEASFSSNPGDPAVKSQLEYFGAKFLVVPCIQDFDRLYPLASANNGVCVHGVDGAPLVTGLTQITRTTERIPNNKTEAVIVEECTEDCTKDTPTAGVTDIKWNTKKITFKTESETKAPVIIRSAYFKAHWHAYVDNKEVEVTPVWPVYMM